MYSFQKFKIWCILFVLSYGCQLLESQNKQIAIRISNDKLVLQDKYYTNGLHLEYRTISENNILFKKGENEKLQTNVVIGNETYTPSNLFSFDVNDFDRPYAGWLYGSVELCKIKPNSALFVALESGITGEPSLAGKLQNAFHDLLNIKKPTWQDEISFKWLFNLKVNKVFDMQIAKNFNLQNHINFSLGSKDTYFQNNVALFFGKLNDFQNSFRTQVLDETLNNEFFGFVGGGYKYVVLNTLIQGSPFRSIDTFTSIAESHIFNLFFGSALKTKKSIFKIELNYNSKETNLSKSHIYGVVMFGFNL